jgi:hypothetical protein
MKQYKTKAFAVSFLSVWHPLWWRGHPDNIALQAVNLANGPSSKSTATTSLDHAKSMNGWLDNLLKELLLGLSEEQFTGKLSE